MSHIVKVLRDIKKSDKKITTLQETVNKIEKNIEKQDKKIQSAVLIKRDLMKNLENSEKSVNREFIRNQLLKKKFRNIKVTDNAPRPQIGTKCSVCKAEFRRLTRCTLWLICEECKRFKCRACLTNNCDCESESESDEDDEYPDVGEPCVLCPEIFNNETRLRQRRLCSCGRWMCSDCIFQKCLCKMRSV